MCRSTIIIISILAMLLLAGSLMGLPFISVDTNYEAQAVITILNGLGEVLCEGPQFTIYPGLPNTQLFWVDPDLFGYVATIYAWRVVNGMTITDTDSHNFTYATETFTLTVDLSGNGSTPSKIGAGH